jgi:RNA polymerase sigma-70 factor (ECF subfamily)
MRLPVEHTPSANELSSAELGASTVVVDATSSADIGRLFQQFGDRVLNYCFYRLGNWEDAEDAAQQVFAKAFAAGDRFRDSHGDPETSLRCWLFTIAHHEVANRRRTRFRRRDVPLESAFDLQDPAPSPEELAVAADHQGRVLGLLAQLSPDQRRVVELRLAGLSHTEIGQVLSTKAGAVRATQFRAISRLRDLLGVDLAGKGDSDV